MCAAKLPASPERRGEAMSSGHRGRGREGKSVGSVISLYRDSKRNVVALVRVRRQGTDRA